MRRDFFHFHASTKSPLAAEVLRCIAALYAIEAEIRGQPAERRWQVRQQRSRPIVEGLHDWLRDHIDKVLNAVERLVRHRYGPRSEKLDLDRLQLVLEDAEQSAAADGAAKGVAEPLEKRRRIAAANRNRGASHAHLPRHEVVIDIERKECPCCGDALHVIGDDRTNRKRPV
jgi:hypothetical protein